MDKKKQTMLKRIEELKDNAIKDYGFLTESVLLLPDGLDGDLSIVGKGIDIDLPYDMHRVRAVRAALGDTWKPKSKNYADLNQTTGSLQLCLTNGKSDLRIWAFTHRPDSICHLVQIGTKTEIITHEVPQYKIVCGDPKEEDHSANSNQ